MSLRPLAPGSQLRKWSNDLFSIISTTTCSMPFEPCGDSAGVALAAVWDKNSDPVRTTPVEAPMSWRKVRRVSITVSMRSASNVGNHYEVACSPSSRGRCRWGHRRGTGWGAAAPALADYGTSSARPSGADGDETRRHAGQRARVEEFGTAPDGRLLRIYRCGIDLPSTLWQGLQKACARALTEARATSPRACKPYDFRHAGISCRLNAGTPAPLVAEWAGHTVEVLYRIYVHCLDGDDERWFTRMEQALSGSSA